MTDFVPYDRQSFERDIEQTLVSDMAAFARLAQRSGMHCHALVDAAACGPLEEQRPDEGAIARLAARHPVEATPLFLLTPEADIAGAGPWLIELPVSDDGEAAPVLLSDLARVAGLPHALSLMASPLRSTTLAIHLRGWFDGRIPADPTIADDEDADAVLRWYDPRVGFDMVALWSEADRDAFLSAFTWAGWDAAFTPRGLRCTRPRDPRASPRSQPMTLGTDLLRAMGALSQADDLLADAQGNAQADAFDAVAPALRRWVAIDQWQQARHLGLESRESCMALLHTALTLHPGVSRLEGLREHLAQGASGGHTLEHLLATRSVDWWAEHRRAAPDVWARWAHHYLEPLRERRMAPAAAHPFVALLPASRLATA